MIAALERWLPEKGLSYKLVHRIAGLGSLGRQRFVALADWRGGLIAREAKALTVSACLWEKQAGGAGEILYQKILGTAVRVLDPWVQLSGSWIVRRLAPDCSRVELAALPKDRDEQKLLHAMGQETANVHSRRRSREGRDPGGLAGATFPVAGEGRRGDGRGDRRGLETVAEDGIAFPPMAKSLELGQGYVERWHGFDCGSQRRPAGQGCRPLGGTGRPS